MKKYDSFCVYLFKFVGRERRPVGVIFAAGRKKCISCVLGDDCIKLVFSVIPYLTEL